MTTIAHSQPCRVVIGVDTHLETHTAVAADLLGRTLGRLTIATTPAGYRQLRDWAGLVVSTVSAWKAPAATAPA